MKTQLQIILRLCCIVLIIALSNKSFAEGTREIRPLASDSGGIEFRFPKPSSMTTFAFYNCPVDYRLNIHVNAGEVVYYGLALKTDNDLVYRIKDPAGNVVAGGGTVPAKGQAGYINTYSEAVAGPSVVVANGYNALSFTATQTGDYYIEFNQNNGSSLVNISFFDFTVVNNGNVKKGRLWSKAWQVSTNNATAQFGGAFYIYSDDQVVTKIDLKGIVPYVFSVAANQFGCFNTGNFTDDRKSVLSAFAVNPQYKVFLNDPDLIEFPTGILGDILSVDVKNDITSSCSTGYCINIEVSKSGNVDVLLNFNGIAGFQAGTADITLSAKVQSGKNCIDWNGKDGLGNLVSALNNVSVEVDYMNGLTNLPLYDVEQATTGFQVSLVRPITGAPMNLFWDDTKSGGIANFIGCLGLCHSFSGNENTINSWWYVSKKSQKQVVNLPQIYTPLNFNYCASTGATILTLNDGNAYTWYKDAAATIPINNDIALSTGVSVNWTPTAGITGDQTLYYTKAVSVASKIGPSTFNQTDWSGANPPLGTLMVINVLNATQFKSFEVNPGWKINNATLYTFTINGISKTISLPPNTTTTVNMNMTLAAGTYTLSSSGGLMYNNVMGLTSIPNTVTLANSGNNSAYANMVFNASSDCAPLTAIAHETCCTKPIIATQPSNVSVVLNGSNTATFSVAATGTGTLTYQWQTDNGTGTFTDIVGANAANFTTSVVTQAMNNYKFQCIVSLNGACSVTTSQAKITTTIQTCIPPVVTNPLAVCQNGILPNLSLNATALTGNALNWYSVATGGTSSLTAPTLSTSTVGTQDVWVSQSINGCESTRAKISFTVHALPTVTGAATPSTICFGSSTTLKGAGATSYSWDNGATDNVAFNPSATTTFTVTGTDINGCKNTGTVSVTVNAIPATPTVTTPTAICQNATAPNMSSYVTGNQVLWYSAATGGTSSASVLINTTSAGTQDYWVTQTVNSCESPRVQISLLINATPSVPTITALTPVCLNATVPLITSAVTGTNLLWYKVASNGTSSSTAPILSSTTAGTFDNWVSQSVNICESARVKISFTVNALPTVTGAATPSTICFGSSTTLKGAGATTYTWDNGATDNVALNPSATTTFTVTGADINGCKNTGTVSVTVNPIPAAPVTTNPTAICQFTTLPDLNLNVTGTNLLWYANLNGGTGTSTIPVLSASVAGNFDVFVSQTINTCESTRSKITLTVNPGPNVPTTTNPTPVCLNENIPTLTATGTNLLWYSTSTGGTSNVTAPILKSDVAGTFDYWVSQSAIGCEGPRAKISFKVNSQPTVSALATPSTICDGENTILKGSGAINYTWDNGVLDNQSFKPTSTQTYTLIGSDANTCKDTIQVTVTVNPIPASPTVTNPADICQNGNVPDLSQNVAGNQIRWYNVATGEVGSVNPIIANSSQSGSFDVWVSQTTLNCESARTKITYTIVPTPSKPTVQNPINVCKSSTTNLSASASGQLKWYTSETSMIGSTTTPIVNTSTIGQQNFWVTNNQSNCESEKVKIQLFVIPNPELEAIVPDFVCSGDSLKVTLNFTGYSPFTLTYQNQGITQTLQTRTLIKQLVLKPENDSNIEFLKLTDNVCATIYQNFIENYVVNQLPKLTIISSDTVCSASRLQLKLLANMPNTYIDWTVSANNYVSGTSNGQFMGTSTNILQTLTNKTANIQYLEYKFNTTNNSCIGETKQVKIILMPSFDLKLNTPNQVCSGESIDFSIGSSVAGYQISWLKNGTIIPNKNSFSINEVITGDDYYEVQATDYCGNTQLYGVSSSIYQPVHFGKFTVLDSCAKFVSNLNILTPENIYSVTWNVNNSLINTVVHHNVATLNYQLPNPEEYPLNVKGYFNGCLLADTSFTLKIKDCSINTVNSFTPNNDGANDKWLIQGIENYTNASLSIFNRWGVKVKSHSGIIPTEAWDGTNDSGELVETGTYYYVLEVRSGIDVRKGYITLMKD